MCYFYQNRDLSSNLIMGTIFSIRQNFLHVTKDHFQLPLGAVRILNIALTLQSLTSHISQN